jgi:hypothetical protein
MKFAYADPPYLGCGKLYADAHPDALDWNDPATHRALIERLTDEWPDGWALSLNTPSLRTILPMCPDDVRVAAACKSFAQVRRTSRVQWMWEPVIFRGGRPKSVDPIVRDYLVYLTHPRCRSKDGIIGGKPRAFSRWVFDLLGAEPGDVLDDLFPGTGAVSAAWVEWTGDRTTPELIFA